MRYPKGVRYFSDSSEYSKYKMELKQFSCPFCRRVGFLNCHGFLWGYASLGSKRVVRGYRFYCSNRGNRGGCGHTYSIVMSSVLRRRQVRAPQLSKFLSLLLCGMSRSAAWSAAASPFSLQHLYRLFDKLSENQSRLRSLLSSFFSPPDSALQDPILHSLEHLRRAFPEAKCPISAFQNRFQEPFPL
jgi:hypothetical protein